MDERNTKEEFKKKNFSNYDIVHNYAYVDKFIPFLFSLGGVIVWIALALSIGMEFISTALIGYLYYVGLKYKKFEITYKKLIFIFVYTIFCSFLANHISQGILWYKKANTSFVDAFVTRFFIYFRTATLFNTLLFRLIPSIILSAVIVFIIYKKEEKNINGE